MPNYFGNKEKKQKNAFCSEEFSGMASIEPSCSWNGENCLHYP